MNISSEYGDLLWLKEGRNFTVNVAPSKEGKSSFTEHNGKLVLKSAVQGALSQIVPGPSFTDNDARDVESLKNSK